MAVDDFTFAWDGADAVGAPWGALRVVGFDGVEEISGLYRYQVTLLAETPDQEIDPGELVHQRATLRIRTLSSPSFKVVHGVIVEAFELVPTPDGQPYRIVLMPPVARARFRKRSRIFLGKTPRQIIDAVLQGDPMMNKIDAGAVDEDDGLPSFTPAREQFTWRVVDASRLDDARVRHFCVQYDESDYDFVARLLEEEGISYHFENGAGACLLVLTDRDAGRITLGSPIVGPAVPGREMKHFHLGARLRPGGVVLDDYNWKKPALDMIAEAPAPAGDLIEQIYPGGYPDSPSQGVPLATARLDRHATEASFASGDGGIRVLSAGTIFQLEHPKSRYDGEYLVTDLRVRGEQQGVASQVPFQYTNVPFHADIVCARRGKGGSVAESRFRPARRTRKPRIAGAQTAVVTAEPSSSAEVNVGGPDGLSLGCVRLKFHWDDETVRHGREPTSCWVRVSQVFAGAAQGAVWHPRVGVEVVVEFEEGDPDRPLVTGRVYNGQNLPPYGGSPVHSTLKSFSTPGGGTWNEVTFDDSAGAELVYMHAGKDMTAIVRNDRLEAVGNDATMKVGVNDVETVGANETITVGVNDTLTIGANDTLTIGANSTTVVGANCTAVIGAAQQRTIGASQTITIGGTLTETVGAAVTEVYKSTRETTVTGAITEVLDANRDVKVSGSNTQSYGPHLLLDWASRKVDVKSTLSTTVNGTVIQIYGGSHTNDVTGTITSNINGGMIYLGPTYHLTTPDGKDISSFNCKVTGLALAVTGLKLQATGLSVSITGVSLGLTGIKIKQFPIRINLVLAKLRSHGPQVYMAGLFLHVHGFTCLL
jgi:type VI secretion system secreted protein VgrG